MTTIEDLGSSAPVLISRLQDTLLHALHLNVLSREGAHPSAPPNKASVPARSQPHDLASTNPCGCILSEPLRFPEGASSQMSVSWLGRTPSVPLAHSYSARKALTGITSSWKPSLTALDPPGQGCQAGALLFPEHRVLVPSQLLHVLYMQSSRTCLSSH